MNYQEQIDEIMDSFDFDNVRRAMECLNWRWYSVGVPEVYHLRKVARCLLKEVCQGDNKGIGTGGFRAERSQGFLKLSFILEEVDLG